MKSSVVDSTFMPASGHFRLEVKLDALAG